jgi:hypothetical protein
LKQDSEKQIVYTVDHLPLFQEARRRWHDAHRPKQVHNICEIDSSGKQPDNDSELSEEYSFYS